jgi:hypothetical protein
MGRRESKNRTTFLFLFTLAAGLAMFISAWNSFQQGKSFIFLSLVFLILFLVGFLLLYMHFLRLFSNLSAGVSSDNINSSPLISGEEVIKSEVSGNREISITLLKSAFNKPDPKSIGEKILKNFAQEFEILQGVFFVFKPEAGKFFLEASYALDFDRLPSEFAPGEGITGQAVVENKILVISNLPESYNPVISGLGKGKARFLYIIPLVHDKKTIGVIEITVFKEIDEHRLTALNQLMREGGMKLYSVLFQEAK